MTGQLYAPGMWCCPLPAVLDRDSERSRIDEMLDLSRRGVSSVLVLRGCPGFGKTTLVRYAIEAASGFRISAIAGVYAEINLPYGKAHQLLIPFLPLMDDLPVPQRQALRVAFGLESGPPPRPFLVGLACLTLLSQAAADQPVLCAVDDAHWIDEESALVLGFVARRLYADRVGVILTVDDSDEPEAFQGLFTMDVGALPAEAAAELLRTVTGTSLERAVTDRVVADTEGNPLALVEVGSHFAAEELAARAYLPEPMPVGAQLQQRYLRLERSLPADAREFVLTVAADGSGKRSRVRKAVTEAGIDADAAQAAAEATGLLEVSGDSIRFRYPLMRTAVYHGASDTDRRRAHHWLSLTSDQQGAPDWQVWHRAAAAAGPAEDLAADLESAADRARSRGGLSATAGLLRRSVALTPDERTRARREVALAEAELLTGNPGTARDVAADVLPRLSDSAARGRAEVVIGDSLVAQGRDAEAAEVLAHAAAALAADPAAAADALLAAMDAAMLAGPVETVRTASIPAPRSGTPPTISDLLLAGYQARFTQGYRAAAAPLRAAVTALRGVDLDPAAGLRWFGLGTLAAGSLWDDRGLLDIADRWARLTRRTGASTQLPLALRSLAFAELVGGRFDQAADRWTEMRELMAASKKPGPFGTHSRNEGLLLAYRGEIAAARAAGLAQVMESTAHGHGRAADLGRNVVAIADLMAGQHEAAVEATLPVIDHDTAFAAEMALPELIEAAARSGNQEVARNAFGILAERTTIAATPWAAGIRARCQALLDEDGNAEASYREAITELGRSRAAVDLARAHLLYGQWLRRARRRRDARGQLRTAEDMFDAMGAAGFAEQAGNELRATGERARTRSPRTEFDLTPQESRVAKLAADGSTNNEIAEQLFISPSTVEYHLAKVFRKLGVRSRTELAHQLASGL